MDFPPSAPFRFLDTSPQITKTCEATADRNQNRALAGVFNDRGLLLRVRGLLPRFSQILEKEYPAVHGLPNSAVFVPSVSVCVHVCVCLCVRVHVCLCARV